MHVLAITPELTTGPIVTMAPTSRQIESMRGLGVQMTVLGIKGIPKIKYLRAMFALQAVLPSIDIVHAHYGYCGWVARTQLRRPVVISFMGDDLLGTPDANGRISRWSALMVKANRLLSRTADAVIVKSAEMANVVAPVEAHVIPNGVDLQAFRPIDRAEARQALGWHPRALYLLFPGNPGNPRKGFPLAQAASEAASRLLGAPVKLVPLWGVLPEAAPVYMNACDAMLMTSFIEGSPNVVKEAMACNTRVVSVSVGDVPELIAGIRGYRLCPRDPESMARSLISALAETEPIEGRAAVIRKRLDLASVAQSVLGIYEMVLRTGTSLARALPNLNRD